MSAPKPTTIVAVGDVSFQGPVANAPFDCFAAVRDRFAAGDLVVANLESPLVSNGVPIPGKCTLRGAPDWALRLRDAGIDLVSLANNHTMDYGPHGLVSTLEALDKAGVRAVGGGHDYASAYAPTFFTVGGTRIAFLARTSVIVSAPIQAGQDTPGVALLDMAETCASIARCRQHADLVVLLMHWGLEEYRYPSQVQRVQGRQLVQAGAQLVIGCHPHVTQGIERHGDGAVVYSLGNFIFSEFYWSYTGRNGEGVRELSALTEENRESVILTATHSPTAPLKVRIEPTQIDDGRACLDLDPSRLGREHVLSEGLRTIPFYRLWWSWYSLRREWELRLGTMLSFSRVSRNILRIRLSHVRLLFESLRRSARVITNKSSNPYE